MEYSVRSHHAGLNTDGVRQRSPCSTHKDLLEHAQMCQQHRAGLPIGTILDLRRLSQCENGD